MSATSVAGRPAYRFAAWLFTVFLPFTLVWSYVCVRALLGAVFSWKFLMVLTLCGTLFTAEYVLRSQP